MKKMIAHLATAMLVVMVTGLSACGNKTEQMQNTIDSLQTALQQREGDYGQLNEFLTVIAEGLDSISAQEGNIFGGNPESPTLSRDQVKRNLAEFRQTLARQRERIAELEKQLAAGKGNLAQLRTIVATLKEQLAAKEAEAEELRAQLEDSNKSVAELQSHVAALSQRAVVQDEKIAAQGDILRAQDEALNEGFVRIGTKAELKAAGLLTGGGLFSKKKVDYQNLDQSLFQKVDIRQATEINIPAKKVKVLTPAPADSYTVQPVGDGNVLTITNPARFWSASKYLIIQTN